MITISTITIVIFLIMVIAVVDADDIALAAAMTASPSTIIKIIITSSATVVVVVGAISINGSDNILLPVQVAAVMVSPLTDNFHSNSTGVLNRAWLSIAKKSC
jgi:hypothetical protein